MLLDEMSCVFWRSRNTFSFFGCWLLPEKIAFAQKMMTA